MIEKREVNLSVDHLLRHNSGQMVAVLTRIFGFRRIEQIEDAVQESLYKALKSWPINGMPDNPPAWLIQTAKNHLYDCLKKDNKSVSFDDEFREAELYVQKAANQVFYEAEISEDQLRLIFACCHPAIPKDSQIALTLKTVGGFNNREIASAFLAKKTAIDKILVRAKQRLKDSRNEFLIPVPEVLPDRVDAVLKVLYLMFNEGYMASEGEILIRKDLCFEAIRLVRLLASHPVTKAPKVNALAALFLFQASRLSLRSHSNGVPNLLSEQNRGDWDKGMINEGMRFFRDSAAGKVVSEFHLEAEIACEHVLAVSFETTNWGRILHSYEQLYRRRPSPIVALNMAFAAGKVHGPERALNELNKLPVEELDGYYPYHLTKAEFLENTGNLDEARASYAEAIELARNESVKKLVRNKLERLRR